MAPKDRTDQVEQRSPLRLPNKVSDASPIITSNLKLHIKEEIQQHRSNDVLPRFLLQMSTMTTLLPSHWEKYPVDMKLFLEKELFDPVLKHVLESQDLLNWCRSVKTVHPLITPGDGNCLLHAVSLALWGIEDDDLILRTALYRLLKEDTDRRNYLRWQRERLRLDAAIPDSGLVYNTTEWGSEWEMVKEIARPDQRPPETQGLLFESLEQFHVFMLANMLRRPIIIIAEDMMRSNLGLSLQPQHLQGIYLPLNWDPSVCYRYPILLGFYQNHFCPLLVTGTEDFEDDGNEFLFPIVHQDLTPMKVHFLEEGEEHQVQVLLEKYLILEEINHMGKSLSRTHGLPGARLVAKSGSQDVDLMTAYFKLSETHYRSYLEMEYGNNDEGMEPTNKDKVKSLVGAKSQPYISPTQQLPKFSWSGSGAPISQPEVKAVPNLPLRKAHSLVLQVCKTEGCIYYRSMSTGEYCHECFVKKQQQAQCKGAGCLNPAENGCQDLCRVCFDQRELIGDAGSKPSAPSMSKMSLNPGCPDPAKMSAATSSPRDILTDTRPHQMSKPKTESPSSSPEYELNSMVVHQKQATKKCIMEECPLTGNPKFSDMCSKCYNESVEIEKGLKKKQQAPAAVARNTGFLAAAAEPPKDVLPESKGTSKYTVKKNICATAGCDGIRLDGTGYAGYCHLCYKRNTGKMSQDNQTVYGASGGSSENETYANFPYHYGHCKEVRPSPEVVKSREGESHATGLGFPEPQKTSEKTVSQNPFADLKTHLATAAPVVAPAGGKVKMCAHHLCDKPASPPGFMLCGQCSLIASMFQQQQVENEKPKSKSESNSKQAENSGSEKTPSEPVEPVYKPIEIKKQTSNFKNTRILRKECQAPGGCVDQMFGDPELKDLCSRCFSKMMMKRTRTQRSPKDPLALTNQEPIYSNTAPLNPSPRPSPPPPRAHTGYMELHGTGQHSPKRNSLPRNYQPCARPGCTQQANLQILEGYCNDCHQVYRTNKVLEYAVVVPAQAPAPKPIPPSRGRFAFSSQSTVPEGWMHGGGQGFGVGTAREPSRPIEENRMDEGPPQAEPNRTDMKCKSDGCPNYGNPRCQGYCNSCFRHMKK
ncbi:uncharacterized protein LOC117296993 isoform X2 [Asterias rubens]|uniref:uncharacterized protein LOC117296993 isoform X2 n=1 Tax=Asterias rubens TaxID=7604 RepID=UPI00145558C6|nr:uncharacterized protein LOC117296993 isoform X2 [Asterias rubens]